MRTAMEYLEAALAELQRKASIGSIAPDLAAEVENGLIEVTTKITELERKLEESRRGPKDTNDSNR